MEQKKDKGANINDSRSLSGGERSFSTICFIMSMWDAMEGPFRCLDEFDVFMVSKIINYTLILSYNENRAWVNFGKFYHSETLKIDFSNIINFYYDLVLSRLSLW